MATKKSTTSSGSDSTQKKATSKKISSKQAAPRKATSRKAAPAKTSSGGDGSSRTASAPRAEARPKPTAGRVAGSAAAQLLELTGKEPEGVTGLERTEDGWKVQVDVVELRRVPGTTDVLATYEVEVDEGGDLQGYRRLRRFVRGTPGEESR